MKTKNQSKHVIATAQQGRSRIMQALDTHSTQRTQPPPPPPPPTTARRATTDASLMRASCASAPCMPRCSVAKSPSRSSTTLTAALVATLDTVTAATASVVVVVVVVVVVAGASAVVVLVVLVVLVPVVASGAAGVADGVSVVNALDADAGTAAPISLDEDSAAVAAVCCGNGRGACCACNSEA